METGADEMDDLQNLDTTCCCGAPVALAECCGPFVEGAKFPATAEQLMRSRYSAYCLGRVSYLVETTHPSERNKSLRAEVEETLKRIKWTSLKVLSASQGQPTDKIGKVEFVAEYEIDGESKTHQERSRFRRFEGRWRYRDDQG